MTFPHDRSAIGLVTTMLWFGSFQLGCGAADARPPLTADVYADKDGAEREESLVTGRVHTSTAGGRTPKFARDRANAKAPAPVQPPPPPQQPAPAQKGDPAVQPARTRDLVVYTARFTMAVYQVGQGIEAVERIAAEHGGYLGHKNDGEIVVRVPRDRFEPALSAIDRVGDVLHREVQAQDVTDEHVDLEIRIRNARAMQQRLSELLSKAAVKEALDIERELHRVTQELELLEGKMKVLADRVQLSTITVAFQARGSTIQTARVHLPFGWLATVDLPSLLQLREDK